MEGGEKRGPGVKGGCGRGGIRKEGRGGKVRVEILSWILDTPLCEANIPT